MTRDIWHGSKMPVLILFILVFSLFAWGRSPEDELQFEADYRVNAHGDEFMALALTSDGRRLIIGTEKGELLVWGIAERKILKRLYQGSPVHCVAALADPRYVVAAGGPHSKARQFGVARRWDIDAGTFTEWRVPGKSTLLTLSVDAGNGLVAASDAHGALTVWDSSSGALIANTDLKQVILGLVLVKRDLFISAVKPADVEKMDAETDYLAANSILRSSVDHLDRPPRTFVAGTTGRLWSQMIPSPDGRMVLARYSDSSGRSLALLDLETGKNIFQFEAHNVAWSNNRSFLLFNESVPTESVRIDSNDQISRAKILEGGRFHGSGTPARMTGQAVSADGATVWEVFQMGSALGQCDLNAKTCELLYSLPGLVYTMDVAERAGNEGWVATGGDDGFVRAWRLSDFSLVSEFPAPRGVPQGVALVRNDHRVVFSVSSKDPPTEIMVGDLVSGQVKSLLKVPQPFVRVAPASGGFIYDQHQKLILADVSTGDNKREFQLSSSLARFSTSPNGEWLAAADATGTLYCFEIKTGRLAATSREKIEDLSTIAVTNDGQYVYTTEWKAALRQWDTSRNSLKEIASIRGQARSLTVSPNGERIAVGGNHRDLAIYESKTGNRLAYLEISSSDFYVTNAWVNGKRLVFTTDSGVLFAGNLDR